MLSPDASPMISPQMMGTKRERPGSGATPAAVEKPEEAPKPKKARNSFRKRKKRSQQAAESVAAVAAKPEAEATQKPPAAVTQKKPKQHAPKPAASRRATGIWNPFVGGKVSAARPTIAPASPAREAARMNAAKSLRSQLHRMCTRDGSSKPPLLAFERWLARAQLAGGSTDPLLPSVRAEEPNRLLEADLARAGVRDPEQIVERLSAACIDACSAVAAVEEVGSQVTVDTKGGCCRLRLNGLKGYLQLNAVHLYKLHALWQRNGGGGKSNTHPEFTARVYCLLARYEALSGAGYQAALNEKGFDVLLDEMAVKQELFASPFNCRYANHCSAFPDVDASFGSLGSFFDFHPKQGSFEANPPFVPETMAAAVEHMEKLLHEATGPLSFVVLVPAWTNLPFWESLVGSEWSVREPLVIPAKEHGFCDGAQHQRGKHERHRVSSYDTGVFFLQNEAGRFDIFKEYL